MKHAVQSMHRALSHASTACPTACRYPSPVLHSRPAVLALAKRANGGGPKPKNKNSSHAASKINGNRSRGGSSNQLHGSKGTAKGAGTKPRAAVTTKTKESYVSAPIMVTTEKEFSSSQAIEASSISGPLLGEWAGQYSAYTPWTGLPEPVWADEGGKYMNHVHCRSVEYQGRDPELAPGSDAQAASDPAASLTQQAARGASDHAAPGDAAGVGSSSTITTTGSSSSGSGAVCDDTLFRIIGRAASRELLRGLKIPHLQLLQGSAHGAISGDAPDAQALEDEGLDVELIGSCSGGGGGAGASSIRISSGRGLVLLPGGHYSAGPDSIGPAELAQQHADSGSCRQRWLEQSDARGSSTGGSSPAAGGPSGAGAGEDDECDDEVEMDVQMEAPTAEEAAAAARRVSPLTRVMESCLVDPATHSRVRLRVTVRVSHTPHNGEADVEVIRLVLYHEQRQSQQLSNHGDEGEARAPGPSDQLAASPGTVSDAAAAACTSDDNPAQKDGRSSRTDGGSSSSSGGGGSMSAAGRGAKGRGDDMACCSLPRPARTMLQGAWRVVTVSAVAAEGSGPKAGEPAAGWRYISKETRQRWHVPRTNSGSDAEEGGVLWLPGGVLASFKMVPHAEGKQQQGQGQSQAQRELEQRAGAGQGRGVDVEGSSGGTGASVAGVQQAPAASGPLRCFCFGVAWILPAAATSSSSSPPSGKAGPVKVLSVDRDYDGAGALLGVRFSTAVKEAVVK